jgi:hypothetical protein
MDNKQDQRQADDLDMESQGYFRLDCPRAMGLVGERIYPVGLRLPGDTTEFYVLLNRKTAFVVHRLMELVEMLIREARYESLYPQEFHARLRSVHGYLDTILPTGRGSITGCHRGPAPMG